jgi:hypothetical protein
MSAPEFFYFFTYVYDIWHVCAFPGENVLHTNIKNCTQLPCILQVHKFHLHTYMPNVINICEKIKKFWGGHEYTPP